MSHLRELLLCYFLVPLCSKVQLSEASVHVEGNTYRLFHDSLKLRETNRAPPIPENVLEEHLRESNLSKSWNAVLYRASGWQRCASKATNSEKEMRPSYGVVLSSESKTRNRIHLGLVDDSGVQAEGVPVVLPLWQQAKVSDIEIEKCL